MRLLIVLLFVMVFALPAGANRIIYETFLVVTNVGDEPAHNVEIVMPLLDESDYSRATMIYGKGTTIIPQIGAGQTRTIFVGYEIELTKPSVNRNSCWESIVAKWVFDKHEKLGNCRELSLSYINELSRYGIEAREVVGWVNPNRGDIDTGCLRGKRHSWVEFSTNGNWHPVDLTFGYFMELPHFDRIVDGYADRPVKVSHRGGQLSVFWGHAVK